MVSLTAVFEEMEVTGINIAPNDAKAFITDAELFESSDGRYALAYMKDDNNFAILVYVDKNVTITGTYTDTYAGETITQIWNCSLKTGWNYVFASQSETTITYTTGTPPSGYKWQVFNADDF
jgi:hypothetical protein